MNPMDILKNMQQLQSRMSDAQSKLKDVSATGTAGGDMVQIEITGEFSVTSVKISPDAVDPDDIEMLQDLVRAAMTDAIYKVKEQIQQEMSSVTGGLNLPPGLFGGA
jgi:DNA-binding YbaB/EbfC family protein